MKKVAGLDNNKLAKLIDALKKPPSVNVGILQNSKKRVAGSNADIGLKHEFGEDGLPVRSFLRMPVTTHLQQFLDKSEAFSEDVLKIVVEQGKLDEWMKLVGTTAEATIASAFATGGFGNWRPSNMVYKKVHQTLVESEQLRESILSKVVK